MILFGWYGGGMPGGQSSPLMSQIGIGGVLEFFGGIAIVLGLFTRPVAFILAGIMAVAYWQFHAPNGAWPLQNQGVPAVLFCFRFLYMAAQGAGTGVSTRCSDANALASRARNDLRLMGCEVVRQPIVRIGMYQFRMFQDSLKIYLGLSMR